MTSPTAQPISLGIFSNLGLSATQTQQIQSIVGKAQNGQTPFSQVLSQVNALLTPTQQSTFKSDLQTLGAHAGKHHHHGGGASSASSALASMLSSSNPDAFGASSSTTTPSSALADAFGVMSSSSAGATGSYAGASSILGNSVASSLTSNSTANASSAVNPFTAIAARYQVQGQLQASGLDNFLT